MTDLRDMTDVDPATGPISNIVRFPLLPLDSRSWTMQAHDGLLQIRPVNDAQSYHGDMVEIERVGMHIVRISYRGAVIFRE